MYLSVLASSPRGGAARPTERAHPTRARIAASRLAPAHAHASGISRTAPGAMASPIARRSGFLGGEVSRGIAAPPRPGRASRVVPKAELSPFAGVALFLTPGALGALYALYLGKGNFSDGFSRLITEVSQGYFNPNAGGENVPVCEGELSDLVGDEPLFKALEKWYLDLGGVYKLAFGPKCFLVISDPIVRETPAPIIPNFPSAPPANPSLPWGRATGR
mmetsp:Transcript_57569/g.182332  ORF Transcript_57569/g.182332 Transcript_57569/m.182332 type:complete len:219 (-) Transcript_57569:164-820(-)